MMRSNGHKKDMSNEMTEWQPGEDLRPWDIDIFLDPNVRP